MATRMRRVPSKGRRPWAVRAVVDDEDVALAPAHVERDVQADVTDVRDVLVGDGGAGASTVIVDTGFHAAMARVVDLRSKATGARQPIEECLRRWL